MKPVRLGDLFRELVKRHDAIYVIVFFLWGLRWLARALPVFRRINSCRPRSPSGKRVLMLSIRTIPTTNLAYFDALFGHAFRLNGDTVKMLFCDGAFDSCDAGTVCRGQRPQCILCRLFSRFFKAVTRLDCLSYRSFFDEGFREQTKTSISRMPAESLGSYMFEGVDVGSYARSSTIRYFLTGMLDMNDPAHVGMLREKLVQAVCQVRIAQRLLQEYKPNVVFMLHGVYVTWGVFYRYFRSKNVDVVVYNNKAERFGHFVFNRNDNELKLVAQRQWLLFRQQPLSPEARASIEEFLDGKFKGALSGLQVLFNKNIDTDVDKRRLLESISGERFKRRYVLYANLAWDAVLDEMGSHVFGTLFEFIDASIASFLQKPGLQLIIKPHPGELIWEKSNLSVCEYVRRAHPGLPANITVLRPDTPLTAYDLITPGTIGMVFNGSLGWELATRGVPVIVAGNSHYHQAGITYPVRSLDDYRALIDDPDPLIEFAKANQENALKYAYYFLYRTMVRVPFYRTDKWSDMDWGKISRTDEIYGSESPLIKICAKITRGEDVIAPL